MAQPSGRSNAVGTGKSLVDVAAAAHSLQQAPIKSTEASMTDSTGPSSTSTSAAAVPTSGVSANAADSSPAVSSTGSTAAPVPAESVTWRVFSMLNPFASSTASTAAAPTGGAAGKPGDKKRDKASAQRQGQPVGIASNSKAPGNASASDAGSSAATSTSSGAVSTSSSAGVTASTGQLPAVAGAPSPSAAANSDLAGAALTINTASSSPERRKRRNFSYEDFAEKMKDQRAASLVQQLKSFVRDCQDRLALTAAAAATAGANANAAGGAAPHGRRRSITPDTAGGAAATTGGQSSGHVTSAVKGSPQSAHSANAKHSKAKHGGSRSARQESGQLSVTGSIHRFILQTHASMSKHVLWKSASPAEMDNALESLEKFILHKVYDRLFAGSEEDRKLDDDLQRKLHVLQFLEPHHLDIPDVYYSESVFDRAAQELRKMHDYKAPRDKIICLLNCCKIILDHLKSMRHVLAAMPPDVSGGPLPLERSASANDAEKINDRVPLKDFGAKPTDISVGPAVSTGAPSPTLQAASVGLTRADSLTLTPAIYRESSVAGPPMASGFDAPAPSPLSPTLSVRSLPVSMITDGLPPLAASITETPTSSSVISSDGQTPRKAGSDASSLPCWVQDSILPTISAAVPPPLAGALGSDDGGSISSTSTAKDSDDGSAVLTHSNSHHQSTASTGSSDLTAAAPSLTVSIDAANCEIPTVTNGPSVPGKSAKKNYVARLGGAEGLLPMLIYCTLKSGLPHVHLTIRYISEARLPQKLAGEPEYYVTMFQLAISFLERVDASQLSIDPELYERRYREEETKLLAQNLPEVPPAAGGGVSAPASGVGNANSDDLNTGAAALNDAAVQLITKSAGSTTPVAATRGVKDMAASPSPAAAAADNTFETRFRFLHTAAADLKPADIPDLLEEYKAIALTLIKLQRVSARSGGARGSYSMTAGSKQRASSLNESDLTSTAQSP